MIDIVLVIFLILVVSIFIVIPPLYILTAYVWMPHKSLREGLSDWYHESDDDI